MRELVLRVLRLEGERELSLRSAKGLRGVEAYGAARALRNIWR